ncbi:hypothetical protein E2C01_089100 [Portunus trituberculatus]|uniref:Uncharacterized protein n=1 Tax=Portunus trituberculatus TaxID=210409 RepID=A0A5B7JCM0_PORTR|nr:hypothetical protein [Portunus trituberculatus]
MYSTSGTSTVPAHFTPAQTLSRWATCTALPFKGGKKRKGKQNAFNFLHNNHQSLSSSPSFISMTRFTSFTNSSSPSLSHASPTTSCLPVQPTCPVICPPCLSPFQTLHPIGRLPIQWGMQSAGP